MNFLRHIKTFSTKVRQFKPKYTEKHLFSSDAAAEKKSLTYKDVNRLKHYTHTIELYPPPNFVKSD